LDELFHEFLFDLRSDGLYIPTKFFERSPVSHELTGTTRQDSDEIVDTLVGSIEQPSTRRTTRRLCRRTTELPGLRERLERLDYLDEPKDTLGHRLAPTIREGEGEYPITEGDIARIDRSSHDSMLLENLRAILPVVLEDSKVRVVRDVSHDEIDFIYPCRPVSDVDREGDRDDLTFTYR